MLKQIMPIVATLILSITACSQQQDLGTTGESTEGQTQVTEKVAVAEVAAPLAVPYSIAQQADGSVLFTVEYTAKQAYVEVFVRKTNVQVKAVNIVSSLDEKTPGVFKYSYSMSADNFENGQAIDARFYSYEEGKRGVFLPGPFPGVWVTPVEYKVATGVKYTVATSYVGVAGATVTLTAPTEVAEGEDLTIGFTFPAAPCATQYGKIDTLKINDVVVNPADYIVASNIVIPKVKSNVTVALVVSIPYIKVIAGANGTVTPSAIVASPLFGAADVAYTITPAVNYSVDQVLVNGVSQGAVTAYSVKAPAAVTTCPEYYTIDASFKSSIPVTDGYVTILANGKVVLSATYTTKQKYVEVFARKTNVQFYAKNIASKELANANGTFTYADTLAAEEFTGGVPTAPGAPVVAIDARFYSYEEGKPGKFLPGPFPGVWSKVVEYK